MKVKDLKDLLLDVDNELDVLISMDGNFDSPDLNISGIIDFGPLCDEDGNELDEQPKESFKAFGLLMKEEFTIEEKK